MPQIHSIGDVCPCRYKGFKEPRDVKSLGSFEAELVNSISNGGNTKLRRRALRHVKKCRRGNECGVRDLIRAAGLLK